MRAPVKEVLQAPSFMEDLRSLQISDIVNLIAARQE